MLIRYYNAIEGWPGS